MDQPARPQSPVSTYEQGQLLGTSAMPKAILAKGERLSDCRGHGSLTLSSRGRSTQKPDDVLVLCRVLYWTLRGPTDGCTKPSAGEDRLSPYPRPLRTASVVPAMLVYSANSMPSV